MAGQRYQNIVQHLLSVGSPDTSKFSLPTVSQQNIKPQQNQPSKIFKLLFALKYRQSSSNSKVTIRSQISQIILQYKNFNSILCITPLIWPHHVSHFLPKHLNCMLEITVQQQQYRQVLYLEHQLKPSLPEFISSPVTYSCESKQIA